MIEATRQLIARHAHVNWALADQAMVSGVNFLTGILLARFLGLEEFGRFTLAWMIILFVASLQHVVINSPMMSIGPKQRAEDTPAYYGAVMIHQLVFAGLVALLVLAGAHAAANLFPQWHMDGLALPLACAALAVQWQDFMRRYFFTRLRGGAAFINDAVRYLGQLAILIWLFQASEIDTTATLWVITAFATVSSLAGLVWLEHTTWNAAAFRKTTRRHWEFSKWLLGSALMEWVQEYIFTIVAALLLGTTAVGALRATENIVGVLNVIFRGLDNVVGPKAAALLVDFGPARLARYLWKVTMLGGGLTVGIAVLIAIYSDFLMTLAYGEEFSTYSYLIPWFAAMAAFTFLAVPWAGGLRAIEATRNLYIAQFIMALAGLVIAYPIIFSFGLYGAAAGILLLRAAMHLVVFYQSYTSIRRLNNLEQIHQPTFTI